MIAIDVSMVATKEHLGDTATLQLDWVNQNFSSIFAFFEALVDQGIILNFIDNAIDGETDVTTYYSMSQQNAESFEHKFQDLSADFSMKKLWNELGFDTSMTMKEIEFDFTAGSRPPSGLGTLIDKDLKTIWGIDFPASSTV